MSLRIPTSYSWKRSPEVRTYLTNACFDIGRLQTNEHLTFAEVRKRKLVKLTITAGIVAKQSRDDDLTRAKRDQYHHRVAIWNAVIAYLSVMKAPDVKAVCAGTWRGPVS